MDSEDDVYNSYDGEYSEDCDEEDYLEEIDEDEPDLEDNDEDGGVSDDNGEDGNVLEESEEDVRVSDDNGEDVGDLEESGEDMGVLEENDQDEGVLDDNGEDVSEEGGGASDCSNENGGASEEDDEDEDDGDNGFFDNAADDLDDPDFSSCNPQGTYTLEFDGASKGNPGKAGAGAVLRNPDGSVARKIMKGVGVTTNNVAEYEALNQGLKYAQSQGIDRIRVKGDSNLVCKQVNGDWKTRSKNLTDLNMEAKNLKSHFKEFHIDYVPRASNTEADTLANDAVNLPDGKLVTR